MALEVIGLCPLYEGIQVVCSWRNLDWRTNKAVCLTVSVPHEHMQLRLFCRAAGQAAAFSIKS